MKLLKISFQKNYKSKLTLCYSLQNLKNSDGDNIDNLFEERTYLIKK